MLQTLKRRRKYNGVILSDEHTLKSTIIAVGSVDQAIEWRHYSRAVRLHKQSLEPLLRYKSEKDIPALPTNVHQKNKELRLHPSHNNNSKCNIYA